MKNTNNRYLKNNITVLEVVFGFFALMILLFSITPKATYAMDRLDYANMTIAEVVMKSGDFDTLEGLISDSDIEMALMEPGSITVFAPTDEAFAKLDADTIAMVMADDALRNNILNLHWVDGLAYSGVFYDRQYLETASGAQVPVNQWSGDFYIADSQVIMKNISTRDGIIHVIDTVITPDATKAKPVATRAEAAVVVSPRPAPMDSYTPTERMLAEESNDGMVDNMTVWEQIEYYPAFETLETALKLRGFDEVLNDPNMNVTVFAPTNEAFMGLGTTLDAVLEDPKTLDYILKSHVVTVPISAKEIGVSVYSAEALSGMDLRFGQTNSPKVENARVINPDLESSNGVIQVIDAVIQ